LYSISTLLCIVNSDVPVSLHNIVLLYCKTPRYFLDYENRHCTVILYSKNVLQNELKILFFCCNIIKIFSLFYPDSVCICVVFFFCLMLKKYKCIEKRCCLSVIFILKLCICFLAWKNFIYSICKSHVSLSTYN
jgi:hypothetical protein